MVVDAVPVVLIEVVPVMEAPADVTVSPETEGEEVKVGDAPPANTVLEAPVIPVHAPAAETFCSPAWFAATAFSKAIRKPSIPRSWECLRNK
jgi:hypothetical protein